MQYALLLWPHANIRYMASLEKLAMNELICLLRSIGTNAQPRLEKLGGAPFLLFDSPALSSGALQKLCCHSSMYMLCEKKDGALYPLMPEFPWVLSGDIAEILKYKGKTNAAFTMLMLNCARSASAFHAQSEPLTVLDPLCGKGTTLFCALRHGDHAIGIEMDKKDLKECGDFFAKYLQLYRLKHKRTLSSLTLQKGRSAPKTSFVFSPEELLSTRTLDLIQGDTLDAALMLKPQSVHLITADLPYGVQHAPEGGAKQKGFVPLLEKALPGWKNVLKPGGAMALSFNTFTLKKDELVCALEKAGFTVMTDAPYGDFEHYVEQAVNRDLVIAVK